MVELLICIPSLKFTHLDMLNDDSEHTRFYHWLNLNSQLVGKVEAKFTSKLFIKYCYSCQCIALSTRVSRKTGLCMVVIIPKKLQK